MQLGVEAVAPNEFVVGHVFGRRDEVSAVVEVEGEAAEAEMGPGVGAEVDGGDDGGSGVRVDGARGEYGGLLPGKAAKPDVQTPARVE